MTTRTLSAIESLEGLPLDMQAEAVRALESGSEEWVDYRSIGGAHMIFFPNAGRGGVCQGGNTDWTDCDCLEDLEERWENYETRWSS